MFGDFIKKQLDRVRDKSYEFSIGHNRVLKVDTTVTFIHLFRNDDGLIEVEVKSGKDELGWIYGDDIDFFTFDALGKFSFVSCISFKWLISD